MKSSSVSAKANLFSTNGLTGSLLRIPFGAMVDRMGGKKPILILLLLAAAWLSGAGLGWRLVLAAAVQAAPPSVADFARRPEVSQVTVSPSAARAALLPTPMRLARRLLQMAEGYGIRSDSDTVSARTLHVSQEKLSAMLSISRQTVNQMLKELENEGLLLLGRGNIEILNLEKLKRKAQTS